MIGASLFKKNLQKFYFQLILESDDILKLDLNKERN